MAILGQFLQPSEVAWDAYPYLQAADNDPLFPYPHGHYMRRTMQQDGFNIHMVCPMQELRRLRVRRRVLEGQIMALNRDMNQIMNAIDNIDNSNQFLLQRLTGA